MVVGGGQQCDEDSEKQIFRRSCHPVTFVVSALKWLWVEVSSVPLSINWKKELEALPRSVGDKYNQVPVLKGMT
jgi:hypothetical protein